MSILPFDVWSEIYKQAPAELGALRAVNKTAREAVDEVGRLAVQNLSQEVQERWIAFFQKKFSKKNPDVVKKMFLEGKLYASMKEQELVKDRALCACAAQCATPELRALKNAAEIRRWMDNNAEMLQKKTSLILDCSGIEELPDEFFHYLPNLTHVTLKNLKQPDERIGSWKNLKSLDLSNSPLRTLPASIASLPLTSLRIDLDKIKTLPDELLESQNTTIQEAVYAHKVSTMQLIGGCVGIAFLLISIASFVVSFILFPPLIAVAVILFLLSIAPAAGGICALFRRFS